VRAFGCDVCGNLLVFENSVCVRCGTAVGFDPQRARLVPVPDDASLVPCANLGLIGCTWLVPGLSSAAAGQGAMCLCCRLTRTRPADSDPRGMAAFARTEAAKRRLVYQLLDLRLPVVPRADDERGLAFDLLSSAHQRVVTGHADGVVTIDLAEGQDAHREAMRAEMAEPYRTLLGHLRHEVGHYYWQVLLDGSPAVERFRQLFGDERDDYRRALRRHYAQGPPVGWGERYISAYATAHPWEDWAETFAHYLHIRDTLQTAAAYGMVIAGPDAIPGASMVSLPLEEPPFSADPDRDGVAALVGTWLPLTYALNAVNRSMGKDDLYPFVLSEPVVVKLAVVHDLVVTLHPGSPG
jgi:hypothetical protein